MGQTPWVVFKNVEIKFNFGEGLERTLVKFMHMELEVCGDFHLKFLGRCA